MKKFILFTFLVICFSTLLSATNMQANFNYCSFYNPEEGSYLETYLSFVGESLIYKKNENGKFQSGVEVVLIFKQGEKIIDYKKYNLLSYEYDDSLAVKTNMIDQQRISLPNGDYDFEISLRDINANEEPFINVQKLKLDYSADYIGISDIELVESFKKTETKGILSKSGYDLLPYTSDFFAEDFEKIAFYAEVYNASKLIGEGEDFLINTYIESYETKNIVGNYKSFKREKAKAVNVIFSSFDIKKLPSGNYSLVIEARNKTNDLLINKKIFFQRSNPGANALLISDDYVNSFVMDIPVEKMQSYIKCLEPISTAVELSFAKNQVDANDPELMKQFFYNFWLTRNPLTPEEDWKKYKELVDITQQQYATSIKRGYETDRGRIFLKHGKPNTISEMKNEPSSYPYEIWHYYSVEGRSNVKFIFYNPDVISNDYPLLHSTMPGEIYNSQWKVDLHKRTNATRQIDQENPREYDQDKTNEYFALPK
ncbi:MAG: GWxTD domain-containing protein [Flavobacteriales bacterium]|nr:GWxTD domain-containing protein [Flavobacteriales bacterium]